MSSGGGPAEQEPESRKKPVLRSALFFVPAGLFGDPAHCVRVGQIPQVVFAHLIEYCSKYPECKLTCGASGFGFSRAGENA
jgi:hypothetical protein